MKIVGIAACPAGLAHTPMAAKALEKAGKKLGVDIKMEQQGIMGMINTITKEEAKAADLVIIASNQHLEGMNRFDGKVMVRVDIGMAVSKSELIVQKCIEKVQVLNKKNSL